MVAVQGGTPPGPACLLQGGRSSTSRAPWTPMQVEKHDSENRWGAVQQHPIFLESGPREVCLERPRQEVTERNCGNVVSDIPHKYHQDLPRAAAYTR